MDIARLGDGRNLATRSGVTLDLAIANLANGNRDGGGNDLGLAVLDDSNERRGHHGGTDNVAARWDRSVFATGEDRKVDGRALLGPVTVIEVVEVARQAAVESRGATQSERAVGADREARSVNHTSLRGAVELELVVGNNGANAALRISEDTVLESEVQRSLLTAVASGLLNS